MNYTQLVANIENFLEDNSAELTTSIDQIIAQAEEMIFQRLPNLPCFASGKILQRLWFKAHQNTLYLQQE
jgi:hypothetical protein